MSMRYTFLAARPDTDDATLVRVARTLFRTISATEAEDSPLPQTFYLWVQPRDLVTGLRWFGFAGSERRQYSCNSVYRSVVEVLDEFVVAAHDDRLNEYVFARCRRSSGEPPWEADVRITSEGPRIAVVSGALTIDYAQKGFDPDALAARDPATLNEHERKAVEYDSAIAVGLRQCYPAEPERDYITILSRSVAIVIAENGHLCTPQRSAESPFLLAAQLSINA